jgi:hypothetical protein
MYWLKRNGNCWLLVSRVVGLEFALTPRCDAARVQKVFPSLTKIVGTLGPKSHSVEVIEECLSAGMSGSPKLSVELNLFTLGLLISIQLRLLCWHVCGCLSYRSRTVRFLMDECFVSSGDPRQFEESRTECQKAVPCKFLTWSVFLITVAQFNFSWIKANDFFQNIIILFGIYRNNTMSNVQHTKIPMTYLERRTIDFPCFEYTKISIFVNWVHI